METPRCGGNSEHDGQKRQAERQELSFHFCMLLGIQSDSGKITTVLQYTVLSLLQGKEIFIPCLFAFGYNAITLYKPFRQPICSKHVALSSLQTIYYQLHIFLTDGRRDSPSLAPSRRHSDPNLRQSVLGDASAFLLKTHNTPKSFTYLLAITALKEDGSRKGPNRSDLHPLLAPSRNSVSAR